MIEFTLKKPFYYLCLTVLILLFSNPAFAQTWDIETIFSGKVFDLDSGFGSHALEIDSDGNLHAVYGGSGLYYAKESDGIWTAELVDSTVNDSIQATIAIGSSDTVHISYYDKDNTSLKYATGSAGNWTLTTVDEDGDVGSHHAIAATSTGKVFICYYDADNLDLKVANNLSGSWIKPSVDSTGDVGEYCSIDIDTDDKLHVAYMDATNGNIKYGSTVSGSWSSETIDDIDSGSNISLTLDGSDFVHMGYTDSNALLIYTTNSSGSWVSEEASSEDVDGNHSIATDDSGNVFLTFQIAPADDSVYLATRSSSSWSDEQIEELYAQPVSLALDSSGTPKVLSINDNEGLSVFTEEASSWTEETVDTSYEYGGNSSIEVDSTGIIHVLHRYLDSSVGSIFNHSQNTSGSWSHTKIAESSSKNNLVFDHSVAIDSSDNLHIAYYNYTSSAYSLDYSYYSAEAWQTETTQTLSSSSYYDVSLVEVNQNLTVAIGAPSSTLGLSLFSGSLGSWNANESLNSADVRNAKIIKDSNGNLHIAYSLKTAQTDLYYATNTSGSWQSELVAEDIFQGTDYVSLLIDNDDLLNIVYADDDRKTLYVAKRDVTWQVSSIDGDSTIIKYDPKAAIDHFGNIHIAYYNETDEAIIYLANTSGSWVSSEVGSASDDTVTGLGLVIDKQGTAHLSYQSNDIDLIYASASVVDPAPDPIPDSTATDTDNTTPATDGTNTSNDTPNSNTDGATTTTDDDTDTAEGIEFEDTGGDAESTATSSGGCSLSQKDASKQMPLSFLIVLVIMHALVLKRLLCKQPFKSCNPCLPRG
jgi:hypothetical protein